MFVYYKMAEIHESIQIWIAAVKNHNKKLCEKIKACQDIVAGAEENTRKMGVSNTEIQRLITTAQEVDEEARRNEELVNTNLAELEGKIDGMKIDSQTKQTLLDEMTATSQAAVAAAELNDQAHTELVQLTESSSRKIAELESNHQALLKNIAASLFEIKTCNVEGKEENYGDDAVVRIQALARGKNVRRKPGGRRRSKKPKRKKSKNTRKRGKSRKSYR